MFAASPTARSGPALGTTIPSRSSSTASWRRWRKTGSMRSAPTRRRRAGCSTWRSSTASASWSACRGSSTSPSSTIETARSRSRSGFEPVSERARAIPPFCATPSATRSRRPIVRWHGRTPYERFIERLYSAAKDEDPDALVTYVNYPSTEYLQLPFLDLLCFNVYLESEELLEAYLARLQNVAGDRPLLMTELGLDSRPPRRGGAGELARLAGPHGIRLQAAPGRSSSPGPTSGIAAATTSTTGTSGSSTATGGPSRRLRAVREAFAEVPFPRRPLVAADLGRRLHLQRRAHDRGLPRGAREARLPGLRGDRRRRRLDGRDRGDRAGVRRPADPHREPRAGERAKHRLAGRDGRDRRLHRRRRPSRPRTGSSTSRLPS